ncbi:Reversal of tor2 lethality [Ascosphaera aggregata]|nr:Reversal of tor2 lethality [Ascosphaera aggregata]
MFKLLVARDGCTSLLGASFLILLAHVLVCAAEDKKTDSDLVGTWTSKTNKVITGSDFYDPRKDEFIEPKLPGISYSFSKDGHYEEALYRVIANREFDVHWIEPTGLHKGNNPMATWDVKYEVTTDEYHKKKRLNLYQYDGSPVNPLLLDDKTPKMLPTTTLNPVTSSTATAHSRIKRSSSVAENPRSTLAVSSEGMSAADRWWWFGVIMTSAGGLMMLLTRERVSSQ